MSNIEILFRAVDALCVDDEFANRMAMSQGDADAVVRYLVDRGLDSVDAKVLALMYIAGARHTLRRFSRELDVALRPRA